MIGFSHHDHLLKTQLPLKGALVGTLVVTALLPVLGQLMLPHPQPIPGAPIDWEPVLLFMHLISDLVIGLAYVVISVGLFIFACGMTHFFSVLLLWEPLYWAAGGMKYLTAIVSMGTAVTIPYLLPRALKLLDLGQRSEHQRVELEEAHAELTHDAELLRD